MSLRGVSMVAMPLLFVASTIGCSRQSAKAEDGAKAGAKGGAASGAAGGRRGSSVVLAASDVSETTQRAIVDGIAVTGTLRPLETVDIRARVEGEIERVAVLEGQAVSAGQVLATFEASAEQSNSASAKADLAAAQAALATAKWNREQTDELFKAGAVPERDQRAAQQEEAAAQARLAAAQAMVQSTSLTVRDTRVLAPITGTIATRSVESGEHVAKGASLFTLVRTTTLELTATVPERQAGAVSVGQSVAMRAGDKELTGTVSRISPTIDPANRTITVYVRIPNPGNQLKGGSFATGRVVLRTVPNALVIPLPALRNNADGSRTYVYRLQGDKIEEVDVTPGIMDEQLGLVQITRGLAAGDRVVTGNVGTLTQGATVQILGADAPARR